MDKQLNNSDLSEIMDKLDRLTTRMTWQMWWILAGVLLGTVIGHLL